MKDNHEEESLSRQLKRVAAAVSAATPLKTAPVVARGPRRLRLARLVSAATVALVVATVSGFTIGRATDTPTAPAPNVNNSVIQGALQAVFQSFNDSPLTVTDITSVQVKEMTTFQYDFGIGSAWKTGNVEGCNSSAHTGPASAPYNQTKIYAISIFGKWTISQQGPGLGDVVPAKHFTVATLAVNADGSPSSDTGFGFPPVGSNGAPLCWGGLPNIAG